MKYYRPAPSASAIKSTIKIVEGKVLAGPYYGRTAMALAHNGQFMVYGAAANNRVQIYYRGMDQMDATPVEGTDGGMHPFLSPDDQWIGFWENRQKLEKVPVTGGVPTILYSELPPFNGNLGVLGADWGPENAIIFSARPGRGLSRISGAGGSPEVLTVPDKTKDEFGHRLPHYLPDNKGVIFTVVGKASNVHPRLALLDLKTRKWREVIKDAADGRYLPTGHLVFLRRGTLMAVAFDIDRLEVEGQPASTGENVMQALNMGDLMQDSGAGQYSVSDSGCLAYIPGGIRPDKENSLIQVDLKGNVWPVGEGKTAFDNPRFSPDGRRIAFQTFGQESFLGIYDLSGNITRLLTEVGQLVNVAWTPDGKRLVFGWSDTGSANLYWKPADAFSPMARLTVSENSQFPGSFTPDGSTLAFVESHPKTKMDILLLDMKSRQVTPYLNSTYQEGWPEISPNGRWLAYASDESGSGQREVWVRPFPGPGGKWQISKGPSLSPIWSKDGKHLFYHGNNQVWEVVVKTEGDFSAGTPRLLFKNVGFGERYPIRNWDLWPDGLGFLTVKADETKPAFVTELILIQNWFEELKRRRNVK
jgi:eukaryotic-like serine/threonine-protein kinase